MLCQKQWNVNKCACSETCKILPVILVFPLFIYFKSKFVAWKPFFVSQLFSETGIPCYYCPQKNHNSIFFNLMGYIVVLAELSNSVEMAFLINLTLNKTHSFFENHGKSLHNLFGLINRSSIGQEKRKYDHDVNILTFKAVWHVVVSLINWYPYLRTTTPSSCYTLPVTELEQKEIM